MQSRWKKMGLSICNVANDNRYRFTDVGVNKGTGRASCASKTSIAIGDYLQMLYEYILITHFIVNNCLELF